jgi:hypothetical protein
MIKDVDDLMQIDTEQFSSDIEELRKEIMNHSENQEFEGEDAIILEVIRVIQDEIGLRNGKVKKKDIKSDVRFLAYINLFNTIMEGSLDDETEFMDEDFDDDDFDDDDDEDEGK